MAASAHNPLVCVGFAGLLAWSLAAHAGTDPAQLPDPLTLPDVYLIAVRDRAEVDVAEAAAAALRERVVAAGALEDPVLSASIDHYPFEMTGMAPTFGRYDWSVTVEQRLPLSRLRGHRVAAARAAARSAEARTSRTELEVGRGAQREFLMLHERRRMAGVLDAQRELTRQLVSAATGRYANGLGSQADLLRAETELSRVEAATVVLQGQERAAVAMLNTSLGRSASAPILRLAYRPDDTPPPPLDMLLGRALAQHPELAAGAAESERAAAELAVMRAMNLPMGMVRVGRASTMAEGPGAMLMLGMSVPLWRSRQRAGVAEAAAMQRMTDADLEVMRRMVEGEITAAHAALEGARARTRVLATEVVPRARAAVDAAVASYAAGQGSLVAVMELARALWDVNSEQVMAETELGLARVRLGLAVGAAEEVP